MGDMTIATTGLQASRTPYQRCTLLARQNNVIIRFQHDQMDLGYLRSSESKTIAEILSMPYIECEAMAQKAELMDIIGRAHNSNEAKANVNINIYGPRREAPIVGSKLSLGKLWLQRPDQARRGVTYENPHFLKINVSEATAEPVMDLPRPGNNGTSKTTARAEQLRKMVEEVYRSVDDSRHLDKVEGGHRVTNKLLRYQSSLYVTADSTC